MSIPDNSIAQETLERTRRIETRLTKLSVAMGVHTQAQAPEYKDGKIYLPSIHTSLKEILDALPGDASGSTKVYLGDQLVARVDGARNLTD